MQSEKTTPWPELPYAAWRETCNTLHLWTQIVGKIRLMQTPWVNHGWHVTLYVTSRGLTTSPIPHGARTFEILFDFIAQALLIEVSDGGSRRLALEPRSVADFHAAVMTALQELEVPVRVNERPCEMADAIPFSADRDSRAYDPAQAHRFWQALVQTDRVLKLFRTSFIGKCSPVHFFWGSFDLAVTRFSGRRAPAFTGKAPGLKASVMREAYSHEVSSAGFWPGGNGIDFPAFYSYAYPVPAAYSKCPVRPEEARFDDKLGEFLLPYESVRKARDPDAALLAFLDSTYAAAADSARWDRASLECQRGERGTPREV